MKRFLRRKLWIILAFLAFSVLGIAAAIIRYPALCSPTYLVLAVKAEMAKQRGDYIESERLYEQALDIISRTYPGTRQHAMTLNNLAEVSTSAAHYKNAEQFYLQSIAILDKTLKTGDPDLAIPLDNLAGVYMEENKWTESDAYYKRAMAIKQKALGIYNESTAMTLDNLGVRYQEAGDFVKAEQLYLQALAVRRRVLGNRHPLTATNLDHLGTLYEAEGSYERAEQSYDEARSIREHALPPDHPDLVRTLGNLASLYAAEGAITKAKPLFDRALKAQEGKLTELHPETAATLAHLGLLYQDEGDYESARTYFERVLAILIKLYGNDHTVTARARLNLGALYRAAGDREKSHGNEAAAQGDYAKAEQVFAESEPVLEKAVPGHPDTALSLGNSARVYVSEGKWDQALQFDSRSRDLLAKEVGEFSPDTIAADTLTAVDLWQTGKHSRAKDLLLLANRAVGVFWSHNLTSVDVARRRALTAAFDSLAGTSLAVAIGSEKEDPSAAATLAALAMAIRKGVRSAADQEVFARVRRDANPETVRLFIELRRIAETLGEIQRGAEPPKGMTAEDVDRKAQDLEQALMQKSKGFREFAALIEPAAVGSALAPGSAFIDVVFWSEPGSIARCAAVVYRGARTPVLVDLGRAEPINEAAERLRNNFENMWIGVPRTRLVSGQAFERNFHATLDDSATLYALTLGKLKPALGDSKDLIISPDGALSTIPWEALRDGGREGRYLIEEGYRIRYVDSLRSFLVRPSGTTEPLTEAVVVANVDYDGGDRKASKRWTRLNGGDEILGSLQELHQSGRIGAVRKLPFGSEEELMSLHHPLAVFAHTHGFFLNGAAPGSDTDSGIVLYGANRKPNGSARDGWLTARDAMLLDLDGTEIVALIGCETGLGAEPAEGVQGLRHALAVAGARSTLLTLWDVGDLSSARFLEEFLSRSTEPGSRRTLEDALAQTRLAFIKGQIREPNSEATTNRWIHPYFWAAATLSGSDGSLNMKDH